MNRDQRMPAAARTNQAHSGMAAQTVSGKQSAKRTETADSSARCVFGRYVRIEATGSAKVNSLVTAGSILKALLVGRTVFLLGKQLQTCNSRAQPPTTLF